MERCLVACARSSNVDCADLFDGANGGELADVHLDDHARTGAASFARIFHHATLERFARTDIDAREISPSPVGESWHRGTRRDHVCHRAKRIPETRPAAGDFLFVLRIFPEALWHRPGRGIDGGDVAALARGVAISADASDGRDTGTSKHDVSAPVGRFRDDDTAAALRRRGQAIAADDTRIPAIRRAHVPVFTGDDGVSRSVPRESGVQFRADLDRAGAVFRGGVADVSARSGKR